MKKIELFEKLIKKCIREVIREELPQIIQENINGNNNQNLVENNKNFTTNNIDPKMDIREQLRNAIGSEFKNKSGKLIETPMHKQVEKQLGLSGNPFAKFISDSAVKMASDPSERIGGEF